MSGVWAIAAASIRGTRSCQEDAFAVWYEDTAQDEPDGFHRVLLVVADGMGGHAAGDVASRLVVDTFVDAFARSVGDAARRLRVALDAANAALAAEAARKPSCDGMGSTLVAAWIAGDRLTWVSVGDSPLWLYRAGTLTRLNADHSMRAVLRADVAAGRLTERDAEEHPQRHALCEAVMGQPLTLVDEGNPPIALRKGDAVVLASDGILTLGEAALAERLRAASPDAPLDATAAGILNDVEALGRPRQDNATLVMAATRDAAARPPAESRRTGWRAARRLGAVALAAFACCLAVAATLAAIDLLT